MASEKVMEILRTIQLDKVVKMTTEELHNYLVEELGLFESEYDFRVFILEYIGKAFTEDNTAFPITYSEPENEEN